VGRSEFPNGEKQFDVTLLPDGTVKEGRAEYPNGEKQFDVTAFKGRVTKVGLSESSNGEKSFDVTVFPDNTMKIGRVELPNGEKRFNRTVLPDGTEKVDLGFRGLHAGQSREGVETVLKQQGAKLPLDCERPSNNGSVSCRSGVGVGGEGAAINLSFSRAGKLVYFQFQIFSHAEEDAFFSSLRQELATTNHKEGEAESSGNDPLGKLAANMGVRSFTWDTPQKAVCLWGQEKECPAQRIELDERHPCFKNLGCTADVTFADNAFLTEGWVKKDGNRPQPKVASDIVFMGLDGGEQRAQVDAVLQARGYKPLACKHDAKELENNCKTRSGSRRFELTFFHDRLSFFQFYYPGTEHDALYQNLVNSLGQPTDFSGKPREGVYSWMTERTVPCGDADNADAKQCTADLLMLSSEDVTYNDALLFNTQVREKTVRMLNASHRY
jgi:hypothetical protein